MSLPNLNDSTPVCQNGCHSTLTNTLNQTAFITLSGGELERARRAQAPLSLIALDIDNQYFTKTERFPEKAKEAVIRAKQNGSSQVHTTFLESSKKELQKKQGGHPCNDGN